MDEVIIKLAKVVELLGKETAILVDNSSASPLNRQEPSEVRLRADTLRVAANQLGILADAYFKRMDQAVI
jgi:hypothetical protein